MLSRVATFAIDGIDPRPVWVEVDIRPGLPTFRVVGMADKAVREARERVRAAVLNSGFEFPVRRITANLAPASLPKVGPGFDAALAVGLLAASGQCDGDSLSRWAIFGELSLGGELRPCRGTLAAAEGARRGGFAGLIVARERASEAALVDGIEVAAATSLRGVADVLGGADPPPPPPPADEPAAAGLAPPPDLADVRGHELPLHALEVAAAGGHNLLMEGPPGSGKTMLARRLPALLPPLIGAEALEVTRIHSVAGLHRHGGLVRARPFRAPHHTISASGLVGGGQVPTPGEATLAHHGVLFLDELSEFPRPSLEALRQPIEDGHVSIVRGQRALLFPTRFMLVAATNPCPCGFAGTADRACSCTESELSRHRRRLSGPLLDRLDLLTSVTRPTAADLAAAPRASSEQVHARVLAARERQVDRLTGTGASCNGQLDARLIRTHVLASAVARRALGQAYDHGRLSARAHDRVLRVARTIADLGDRERVELDDVLQALALRLHDSGAEASAA
ncbi:MAG TPA: YifB family Mg chelatase-like AAA ATPase [Conexibacter sp.]